MTEEKQPQDAENLDDTTEETQATEEGEKDWEAEAKKYKAIADRKAKQLETVKTSLEEKKEEPKKPNTESITKDEVKLVAKLYAKGYEDNEIEMAQKIATLNGISVDEALKDDYLQSVVNNRKRKETSSKAQVGPATSGSYQPEKEPDSRDDHKNWYEDQMNKLS
jgi:hypothetical protein